MSSCNARHNLAPPAILFVNLKSLDQPLISMVSPELPLTLHKNAGVIGVGSEGGCQAVRGGVLNFGAVLSA